VRFQKRTRRAEAEDTSIVRELDRVRLQTTKVTSSENHDSSRLAGFNRQIGKITIVLLAILSYSPIHPWM
jgi:hypothetical protein